MIEERQFVQTSFSIEKIEFGAAVGEVGEIPRSGLTLGRRKIFLNGVHRKLQRSSAFCRVREVLPIDLSSFRFEPGDQAFRSLAAGSGIVIG